MLVVFVAQYRQATAMLVVDYIKSDFDSYMVYSMVLHRFIAGFPFISRS